MRPPVHENLTVAVNVPFEENENVGRLRVRRLLHDSPRIRIHPRHSGRKAIRFGIVLRLPGIHELFRLREQHDLITLFEIPRGDSAAAIQHAGKVGAAVRKTGRGRRRLCGRLGGLARLSSDGRLFRDHEEDQGRDNRH